MNVRTLFSWPVTAALLVLAILCLVSADARFAARRAFWACSWLPIDSQLRNQVIADRAAFAFRAGYRRTARNMLARHPVGRHIYHTLEREALPHDGAILEDEDAAARGERAASGLRALAAGDVDAFDRSVGFNRHPRDAGIIKHWQDAAAQGQPKIVDLTPRRS